MVDVGCRTGHRFSHDTGAFGLTGPCLSLSNDYHLLFNQLECLSLSKDTPLSSRALVAVLEKRWSISRPFHDVSTHLSCSYSLLFASRGANVVVNDFNAEAAQKVVDEISKGLTHHA